MVEVTAKEYNHPHTIFDYLIPSTFCLDSKEFRNFRTLGSKSAIS